MKYLFLIIFQLIVLPMFLFGCCGRSSINPGECYANKDFTIYSYIFSIDRRSWGTYVYYRFVNTEDNTTDIKYRDLSESYDQNYGDVYVNKIDCKYVDQLSQLIQIKNGLKDFGSKLESLEDRVRDLEIKRKK